MFLDQNPNIEDSLNYQNFFHPITCFLDLGTCVEWVHNILGNDRERERNE